MVSSLLTVDFDHFYERFARPNTVGALDVDEGIQQFIVGTGGWHLHPFGSSAFGQRLRAASLMRSMGTVDDPLDKRHGRKLLGHSQLQLPTVRSGRPAPD